VPRRPELNVESIEGFSGGCCAERGAIKYSENSGKPEVDFEPNWDEIVLGIFLPKKAVLAEANYATFLFLLGPIYGQNMSEINLSLIDDFGRLLQALTLKNLESLISQ